MSSLQPFPEAREVAASSVVTITTDESNSQQSQEEPITTADDDQHHPQAMTASPSRVKWIQREEEAQESILAKLAKVVEPFLNKENKKTKNIKNIQAVQVPYHPQPTSRQRSRSHSADGSRRIDDHPLSPQYPLRYPKVSQSSPVRNNKGKENQPSASKPHSHKQQHVSTNNTSSSSINRSSANVSESFAFAELALELQNERTENVALKQHIASLEKQLSFARTESDRAANIHRSLAAQQTRDNAALRSHLTQARAELEAFQLRARESQTALGEALTALALSREETKRLRHATTLLEHNVSSLTVQLRLGRTNVTAAKTTSTAHGDVLTDNKTRHSISNYRGLELITSERLTGVPLALGLDADMRSHKHFSMTQSLALHRSLNVVRQELQQERAGRAKDILTLSEELHEARARAVFLEGRGDDLKLAWTAQKQSRLEAQAQARASDDVYIRTSLALGEKSGQCVELESRADMLLERSERIEAERDELTIERAESERLLRRHSEELTKCLEMMRQTIADAQGQLLLQVTTSGDNAQRLDRANLAIQSRLDQLLREYEELWTRSQCQDDLLRSSTESLTALAAKYTDATNPPSPHKTTMRKMADREAEIQQLLRDKDHDCQEQVRVALERVAAAEAEVSAHAEKMAKAVADSEQALSLAHEVDRQGLVQAHEAEVKGLVQTHELEIKGLAEQHRTQMQLLQSEVVRDTEMTQSQVMAMGQRLAAMSAENQTLRQQLMAASSSFVPSSSSLPASTVVGDNPSLAPPPSSSSLPLSISVPSVSSSMMVSVPSMQSPQLQSPLLPTTASTNVAAAPTTPSMVGTLQQQPYGNTAPPTPKQESLTSPLAPSATHSLPSPLPIIASSAPQASSPVKPLLQPYLTPLPQSVSSPTTILSTPMAAVAATPIATLSSDRPIASISVPVHVPTSTHSPFSGVYESPSSSSSSSSVGMVATAIGANAVPVLPAIDSTVASSMPVPVLLAHDNEVSSQVTQLVLTQEQQQQQQQQQPYHQQESPQPPQQIAPAAATVAFVPNDNSTITDRMSPSSSSLPSSQSSSSSSSLLSLHQLAVVVDISQCPPVPPPSSSLAASPFFSLLTTTTPQPQQPSSSSGLSPGQGRGVGSQLDLSFAHVNRASRLLDALRLAASTNTKEQGPESGGNVVDSKVVVLDAPSMRLALSMLADEVLCLQQQLLAVGEAFSRLSPAQGQGLGPESAVDKNSSRTKAIYEERLRCHEERYRKDLASLQREIQGYRQTLGMASGQGLEPARGHEEDEDEDGDEEENVDEKEEADDEGENEEDIEEEDERASSDPTLTVQGPPIIQQQQQRQAQVIKHVAPPAPSSSSSAAVGILGMDAGHVRNPSDDSSQQQQQLVKALMDQLQRVQAEAQAPALGTAEGQGMVELTSRLRRAEARSIALDQQIRSMPPSLQVAQAEKRVSEARLQSALLACQQSLSSHTQLFESQRAEWRAMMALKEEERRRLSAKVLSMKETVHQLTHHLHALQSQARAREELDQETDRITAANLGGRGPRLALESRSDARLMATEVQRERERLTPAPWAHASAMGQGLAQPHTMPSSAAGTIATRTTPAAFTAATFTADAHLHASAPPMLPATSTMFTPSHPSATPTITPSYQYVNNTVTVSDSDTPATVVPSYNRYNNLPNNNNNNNNNINDDNNNDLMSGMAMAALDHSLLSNTTAGNNHTITADNDGNSDPDDLVVKASSQDSDDAINTKGEQPSLSNYTKGNLKKKTKGKG